MSEESSITVVQKEKNPKRVEGGKRLAAFNKAAREKMNTTQFNTISDEKAPTNVESAFPLVVVAGVVGGISGLVYYYFNYFYKSDKTTVVKDTETVTEQKQEEAAPKKRLLSLD